MYKTSVSFDPLCVADVLGLGTLDADDDGIDHELLCDLYRHARGEDGKRVLFANNPSFKRGWIDLESPRARELVEVFVAQDDVDDLKHARRIAQTNLEAQPWNDLLGINDPPIQLKVKIHGSKWAMRFQSSVAALKGQEQINEQLPPIPGDTIKADNTGVSQPPQSKCPTSTTATATVIDPAEILRRGGLPA